MKGKDGQTHAFTLQAASVFDAADQAVSRWARLWWFQDAMILVKSSEESWWVSQDKVPEWRKKNR